MQKVFAVIGDPIGHSLSPPMHNAAFGALGLPHTYVAFHVKRNFLRQALEGVKALGIAGLNVTIPHKEACMQYLDFISKDARAVGAVNTVVHRGARLEGYNTDVGGFTQSLLARGVDPAGRVVAILGAGGAARAVVVAAVNADAGEVRILARDPEKALSLTAISSPPGAKISIYQWGEWESALVGCDLIVNATPLGMKGVGGCPLPPAAAVLLHRGQVAVDLVYNPIRTEFLQMAADKGCFTVEGTGMLIYQGAEAFRLFTGLQPPVEVMARALYRALGVTASI